MMCVRVPPSNVSNADVWLVCLLLLLSSWYTLMEQLHDNLILLVLILAHLGLQHAVAAPNFLLQLVKAHATYQPHGPQPKGTRSAMSTRNNHSSRTCWYLCRWH